MDKYILDGKIPKREPDLLTWAAWYEKADRHVKRTHLPDGVFVSTVFLGTDHRFFSGPPMLFETMIFGGEHDGFQQRYATWEEAEIGHEKAIELIFS